MPTRYYPFAKRDKIGPGPMGRTTRRAGKWDCSCQKESKHRSVCICKRLKTDKGKESRAVRKVVIDLDKKRAYGRKLRRHNAKKAGRKYQPKRK